MKTENLLRTIMAGLHSGNDYIGEDLEAICDDTMREYAEEVLDKIDNAILAGQELKNNLMKDKNHDLFLDALTDITLHIGWEHVEFEDSKARSITLRSWANEFAVQYAEVDWEVVDYINTVDEFAAKKVEAYLNQHPQMGQSYTLQQRITDINVYSGKDNKTYIRCKIDGEQQIAKQMSLNDVLNFSIETDRQKLAAKYYKSILEESPERSQGMKR